MASPPSSLKELGFVNMLDGNGRGAKEKTGIVCRGVNADISSARDALPAKSSTDLIYNCSLPTLHRY